MPEATSPVGHGAPPDASSRLHVLTERPPEIFFSFEQRQSRLGVSASVLSHILLGVIAIIVMNYTPEPRAAVEPPPLNRDIVWMAEPGPGGGGGGGGNESPEPPQETELPGKEAITVPVEKKPELVQPEPEDEPPVEQAMNIPAKTMADATMTLPGVIESPNVATTAQGSGTGGGGGTGTGTGVGSGQGSGLGPGFGGGTGGGAYRPGAGITLPRLIREVKPQYTADAMRAKVQGTVLVECVVLRDGSVGDVRVTRSLDPVFGLDQEAVKAAREWKFVPGTKGGEPVPVIVTIELTFTLR